MKSCTHRHARVFLKPGPQLPDFRRLRITDLTHSIRDLSTGEVRALLITRHALPQSFLFSMIRHHLSDQQRKKTLTMCISL